MVGLEGVGRVFGGVAVGRLHFVSQTIFIERGFQKKLQTSEAFVDLISAYDTV